MCRYDIYAAEKTGMIYYGVFILKGYVMKRTKIGAVMLSAAIMLMGCSVGDSSPDDESSVPFGAGQKGEGPASMIEMSSQQLVDSIRIGWNLGNSLDACLTDRNGDGTIDEFTESSDDIDETLWGNPYATRELFMTLVDEGVNAVRLPVTWRDHIDEDGNIDEAWFNRVQQVVEFAYSCGMYVIINMQHDGDADLRYGAWLRNAAGDFDGTAARYRKIWSQIADRFRNYNERLLFESMNEVSFSSLSKDKAYETLNALNQVFVDTIRSSGGNNPQRHLLIAGYRADIEKTCDSRFVMPDDPAGKCIVSVHYYTPPQFCTMGLQSVWGSQSEQKEMNSLIGMLGEHFTDNGIPVIISEYSAESDDAESVVFFCERLVQMCDKLGIGAFLWDGGGEVDRDTYLWRTPKLLNALQRATRGIDYTPAKGAYHEFASHS